MGYAPITTFVSGRVHTTDNMQTNSASAGDVLKVGNSHFIAVPDIAASTDGTTAGSGAVAYDGGVYDIPNGTNGAAISVGNVVRWDTTNKCASTSTNFLKLGFAQSTVTTSNATLRIGFIGGLNL